MAKKIDSITVVAGNYPAPGHPALVFVQQLVHAMIRQGVRVTVVAEQSVVHAIVRGEKLLPRHNKGKTEQGVEYDIYRPHTLSFGRSELFPYLTKWFNVCSILSKVHKADSDVLYAHFWSSALPICRFASKRHIPLFVACGEGDDALEEMVSKMSKLQLDRVAKSVSGVVSVSSENMRKCINYGLIEPGQIEVFPNCVNIDVFHKMDVSDIKKKLGIKDDDFVVCFVGAFIPRKGPDRVAQAVKNLNDPKIKVMFIGRPLSGFAYDFDCPGIVYKGPVDHESLPQYINCSNVFVLPTRKEGCSNAIVEALAIGLPVISSDGPFNDDILNDKNSIRVNADDVEAIAAAICQLRDDEGLRRSMAEYSLSHQDEYSIEGRARRILHFMEQLTT